MSILIEMRAIILGTKDVLRILYTGHKCQLLKTERAMSNWEAHACTASPGSIAYPSFSDSKRFCVEEMIDAQPDQ